nr:MAG TPA: hypothetical protein [Caudoviricetes sp.]
MDYCDLLSFGFTFWFFDYYAVVLNIVLQMRMYCGSIYDIRYRGGII